MEPVMIKSLKYKIDFSNGQSRSNDAEFENGSTMITGKNGRGKSLNLELIAFCLFGSKALRGLTEDYSRIKAELNILIKEVAYTIKRTKSGAEVLNAQGETLAKGNKPVNEFLETTLGFGFDVFRINHWCAQGDIQALANMKPTERKQMIDDVAGLNKMDALIKMVSEEAKQFRAGIESAEQYLLKPTAPIKPDCASESELREGIENAEQELSEYNKAEAEYLALRDPIEPQKPVAPKEPQFPEQPKAYQPEQPKLQDVELPSFLNGEDPIATLAALKQRQQSLNVIQLDIKGWEDQLAALPDHIPLIIEKVQHLTEQDIRDSLEYRRKAEIKQSLLEQGNVNCPNCNFSHPVAQEALKQYEDIEEAILDARPITLEDYAQCKKFAELTVKINEAKPTIQPLETINLLISQLEPVAQKVEANNIAQAQYESRLQDSVSMNKQALANWQATCQHLRESFDQQMTQYQIAVQNYDQAFKAFNDEIKRQQNIAIGWEQWGQDFKKEMVETIAELRSCLDQWSRYNALNEQYKGQMKSYELGLERLEVDKAILQDRINAKKALVEVKAQVKTFIIPSLNKVASFLLGEMTGGEHCNVEIDENFEVNVDGTPLRTMSGSGKDITNLAIRIGLGRILTHKTLPLMMLDEIDAAMDEDRANYTWNCIQNVTSQIGQILQVSHKQLPAQHTMVVS